MVIRQDLPFCLSAEGHRPPSHLKIAIGVSIALHVVIGLYVAFLQFTGPPAAVYDENIIEGPWIIHRKPPPPPPPTNPKPQPQPPRLHEPVPISDPPVTSLDAPPVQPVGPVTAGPIATLNPPPVVDPAPKRDPIIHDPRWVRRPDAGDFARFYPERALRLGREGSAEITCTVTAGGQVRDCRVTGETPDTMGFGQAALKLSRFLQIAPKTIDGQPVDGGILIVPIQFRLS